MYTNMYTDECSYVYAGMHVLFTYTGVDEKYIDDRLGFGSVVYISCGFRASNATFWAPDCKVYLVWRALVVEKLDALHKGGMPLVHPGVRDVDLVRVVGEVNIHVEASNGDPMWPGKPVTHASKGTDSIPGQ